MKDNITPVAKIALVGHEIPLLKSFLEVSAGLVEPPNRDKLYVILRKIERAEQVQLERLKK